MSKYIELLHRIAEGDNRGDFFISNELLKEIEAILAQPEQEQEPVAWMDRTYGNLHEVNYGDSIPLYTAPPTRKPLTSKLISLGNNCHESFIKGVRFAEKMHGIQHWRE